MFVCLLAAGFHVEDGSDLCQTSRVPRSVRVQPDWAGPWPIGAGCVCSGLMEEQRRQPRLQRNRRRSRLPTDATEDGGSQLTDPFGRFSLRSVSRGRDLLLRICTVEVFLSGANQVSFSDIDAELYLK